MGKDAIQLSGHLVIAARNLIMKPMFSIIACNETNLDVLAAQVTTIVQDTMQPEGLSLWLKETRSVFKHRILPEKIIHRRFGDSKLKPVHNRSR